MTPSMPGSQNTYEVVCPTPRTHREQFTLVSRQADLSGKRIGFLSTGVFHSSGILDALGEQLRGAFEDVTIVESSHFQDIFGSVTGDECRALRDDLQNHPCDAGVIGV